MTSRKDGNAALNVRRSVRLTTEQDDLLRRMAWQSRASRAEMVRTCIGAAAVRYGLVGVEFMRRGGR